MYVTIILFIFALPIGIYYCYARPKNVDLVQVSFALISCNLLIQLFLLIPAKQPNIPNPKNIDYSPTASIKKKSETKSNINPLSPHAPENVFIQRQKKVLEKDSSLLKNHYSSADIICYDCGFNVSGDEPDFSKKPPLSDFMWSVQGKIIKSFHYPENDGVNIAVPIGTDIKSVEAGQVAYAGEQFSSYGKLILIRHDNGYVSAYGHNSQLMVAKGDRVYSGQTIAKSGQSGNVFTPQLLFQLRKGGIPIDPIKFMPNSGKIIGSK